MSERTNNRGTRRARCATTDLSAMPKNATGWWPGEELVAYGLLFQDVPRNPH